MSAKAGRPRGTLYILILHAVRLRIRSVVVWGSALGLLALVSVAFFPSMEDQGQQINELIESYPPEMREAFGIGEGTDLTTIEGYMASQVFSFMAPLALAFFPILASSAAIAGAEERGTIDVLLGNPLPRWQLVAGNFAATAISLLGILFILGLFTWVPATFLGVEELSVKETAEAVLNLWPLCLFFGALAMLCSALFHRRVLATAIPGAVLVAMYFVNALGNTMDELKDAQPFSVFHYYGSAIENGIEWADFTGVTAVAFLFVLLASLAFRRRDIYT
ncbi:MAG TPA: ABC transporter permease subunit [Rubrobacter sp.]|nr:ABC transporter permease subunit [Rubrobacter sp.]MBA3792167.1 ABC transporter permease subunit [Rubrobacter sp.]MDQ3236605.1 ABC transporter permease [Actinomycetota bacterium]MDQ3568298.1 ABC transporter permease [Actinomycetota bacterium]HEV8045189.1 ABC transporter permease subunit [Rubrobacter sp.]